MSYNMKRGFVKNGPTYFWNVSDHVESNFREMIVFSCEDLFEAGDCLLEGDQLAGVASENLSDLQIKQNDTSFLNNIFVPTLKNGWETLGILSLSVYSRDLKSDHS